MASIFQFPAEVSTSIYLKSKLETVRCRNWLASTLDDLQLSLLAVGWQLSKNECCMVAHGSWSNMAQLHLHWWMHLKLAVESGQDNDIISV